MTNKGAGGTRSYDVAKHMVRYGHEVYMICGIYDISGIDPMPWYKLFRKEHMDGIEVTICNVYYSNKFNSLKRYWAFLWFAVLASVAVARIKNPELVFATSTPLTVGIPGHIGAHLKKVPFIFEVRDLWPESFVRSGWVKGTELSIKLMEKLEVFLYNRARKILLVSPGFEQRLIERGYAPGKLRTILLGADGSLFEQVTPDHEFLKTHNLEGKSIAIFTGAHGKANGLDYVVDAAAHSMKRPDIAYVLIGEGSEKNRLKERAKEEGLTNIIFADAVPKEQLSGILAVCQIGLMILKDIGEPRPVTPNKIFDYMFMAMPSIVNFEGPTIDMVRQEECGLFANPHRPEDLAEKIHWLTDNPEQSRHMGQNGKKAAFARYDRKTIATQLIDTFQEVLDDVCEA